jgi:hypothetical protein
VGGQASSGVTAPTKGRGSTTTDVGHETTDAL